MEKLNALNEALAPPPLDAAAATRALTVEALEWAKEEYPKFRQAPEVKASWMTTAYGVATLLTLSVQADTPARAQAALEADMRRVEESDKWRVIGMLCPPSRIVLVGGRWLAFCMFFAYCENPDQPLQWRCATVADLKGLCPSATEEGEVGAYVGDDELLVFGLAASALVIAR